MKTGITITHDAQLLKSAGWEDFIHHHPDGNFFQLPQAFELFGSVPGYTPMVTGALEEGKVVGILVSVIQQETAFYGFLTARAIVWGGPVLKSPEIAEPVLKAYDQITRPKAIYTQFRNIFDCSAVKDTFQRLRFDYLQHLNYQVPTRGTTGEQLLSGMSKSKSRQIKKGLQQAEIITASKQAEVDEFYALLKKMYREKVHKPLPPKIFFDRFFENLCSTGYGQYLLIRHEGKIIGGIMCPLIPGKAIYEWYIAGLDKDYKDQYPSILATWAAIEYGAVHQLECFDFLGAGKPDQDYGVREFKSKFGGTLVQYGRFEKAYKPLLMKIGETGLKLYKHLKRS